MYNSLLNKAVLQKAIKAIKTLGELVAGARSARR